MPQKWLHRRQSCMGIPHHHSLLAWTLCIARNIQTWYSNCLHTMFVVRILVKLLKCKSIHTRQQLSFKAHRINLAPSKSSVLWKHHARLWYQEQPITRVHHQLCSGDKIDHNVLHSAYTVLLRLKSKKLSTSLRAHHHHMLVFHHQVYLHHHVRISWMEITPCYDAPILQKRT